MPVLKGEGGRERAREGARGQGAARGGKGAATGIVTIVGHALAKVGTEFQYEGLVSACFPCKLRKVCHAPGLKQGLWYKVTKVRDVRHPESACGVFDGEVCVVEVESVPPLASIPMAATRGTGTHWQFIECSHPCPYKKYCQAAALHDGEAVEIVERVGPPKVCLKGLDLMIARLKPTGR